VTGRRGWKEQIIAWSCFSGSGAWHKGLELQNITQCAYSARIQGDT